MILMIILKVEANLFFHMYDVTRIILIHIEMSIYVQLAFNCMFNIKCTEFISLYCTTRIIYDNKHESNINAAAINSVTSIFVKRYFYKLQ